MVGLRAGHEVPAVGGFGVSVALEVNALASGGDVGSLGGIDADDDDVEVLAGNKLDHLESAGETVELLGTEHGALVVNERENGGALAEVAAQLDGFAHIVGEGEVERQLLVEALLDAHTLEDRRTVVGGAHLLFAVAGDLRRRRQTKQECAKARRGERGQGQVR